MNPPFGYGMPQFRFNDPQINIMPEHLITEEVQFRFPRSKSRRIRAKWTKDRRNWRRQRIKGWPKSGGVVINGAIWCDAESYYRLMKELGR